MYYNFCVVIYSLLCCIIPCASDKKFPNMACMERFTMLSMCINVPFDYSDPPPQFTAHFQDTTSIISGQVVA